MHYINTICPVCGGHYLVPAAVDDKGATLYSLCPRCGGTGSILRKADGLDRLANDVVRGLR